MKKFLPLEIIGIMIFSILVPVSIVSAQVAQPNVCSTASSSDLKSMCNDFKTLCSDIKNDTQKNNCSALKKEIEGFAKDEKDLNEQIATSGKLSKEVAMLTAEINKKKSDIAVKNKTLQQLAGQITEKKKTIQSLDEKRQNQETSLAQILRKKHQFDDYSFAEMFLSQSSLSSFFEGVDQLEVINKGIQDSLGIVKKTKQQTNKEKETLEERRNRENNLKYELENQKKSVETTQTEKNKTLQVSKGQEANYQAVLKDRQKRISQIRSALIQFQGSGISSKSISFGQAYDYAKLASQKTGVDPAFVLAIMQQESGFGNNVGGCYITDLTTGNGVGIQSGTVYEKVMGSGSLSFFETITRELGLDWKKTPISCPIDIKGVGTATKYYDGRGYGGAMGYTQFIPSTWVLVNERVKQNLGISVANPWNPRDAVMATAVFVLDKGAIGDAAKNYNAYYNAACKYYGSCSNYATSVMNKATIIKQTINQLEQLSQ